MELPRWMVFQEVGFTTAWYESENKARAAAINLALNGKASSLLRLVGRCEPSPQWTEVEEPMLAK